MNQLLDLVMSLTIFAIFMLMIVSINTTSSATSRETTMEVIVQQDLVTLAKIIDTDFARIGYDSPQKFNPSFLDSTTIMWYYDRDQDGNVDSLSYYLGTTAERANTDNPNDRILYRKLNNEPPTPLSTAVVNFTVSYLDSAMTALPYATVATSSGSERIKALKLQLHLESYYSEDGNYPGIFWENTIIPANIQ